MNRQFVVSLWTVILLLLLFLAGYTWVGSSFLPNASDNPPPEEGEIEQLEDGLQVNADLSDTVLEPGDKLMVNVAIKNASGKTLHYNGRCGIPIHIVASASDGSMNLTMSGQYQGCEDIYDPADIRSFEAGEILEEQETIEPKIPVNQTSIDAPQGTYELVVSFRTEEGNAVQAKKNFEIENTDSPIISKEEAIQAAEGNREVRAWMTEHEDDGIVAEEHFLSDYKWVIMYHTENFEMQDPEPEGQRIVIHVNARSADVEEIFYEDFSSGNGI